MRVALAVLAMLAVAGGARAAEVTIQAPTVQLRADYVMPQGTATGPGIVALHGCGGPFPARDGQWRDLFAAGGHPVLLPDSFGSRGLGSQCTNADRSIGPNGKRRSDAVAAAQWLAAQPGVPPGGVVVVGWSNGGSTVLAAATQGVMPAGLVRGYVAFYPGCRVYAEKPAWAPSGPMLIIMGEADDWTPAAPCRTLAERFPALIKLVLIPGAYHDFDAPGRPVRERHGLAFTAGGGGVAHVGTNEPGRQQAMQDVPAWIAALPPVR